ncbi:MAG: hypothetical protein PHN38_00125 [Sulfurospirillaceae bacterium]|nr:hypothetical protein [Sulfurospirillaceae bacterium]
MKKWLHVAVLVLLFAGCSLKTEINSSQPYLISLKNRHMAFSDAGFLNLADGYTNMQIFSTGALLLNLEVTHNVCLDGKCYDKLAFNRLFFDVEHYEELINDLLHMKPIFGGKNRVDIDGGFEQVLTLGDTHIVYRIQKGTLYFKDSKHGILMKLKPLEKDKIQ